MYFRGLTGLVAALPLVISTFLFAQEPAIRLEPVASGLAAPTDIQDPGDGSGRLFIVEQGGRIRILRDGRQLVARPFLDISDRITAGGERGLLGLAFPPAYANKRYFYVNYTDRRGDTVVSRYRVSSDPDLADRDSESVLLTVAQPFSNHNGGQIRFGPDGYLYIGMGDGGSGGDPRGNAQNRGELLGKMLRIDVESRATGYAIPPDNPFAGDNTWRPEIWAFGLRNPWRFSFDRQTADLWIADVGQNRAEEINFTPAASRGGENYGWNIMEGLQCYPASAACNRTGLILPVHEYGRSDGCSVTGGFVYRGTASPSLRGVYLFADFCTGRLWGLRREGDRWSNRLLLQSGLSITTFGEDHAGEVYLGDQARGGIYRIATEALAVPFFSAESVVNAASGVPGLVPGSLATLYATGVKPQAGISAASGFPLPQSLDGVSVTIDGRPVPLLAVANGAGGEQINIQVPFELQPGTRASIVIRRGDAASAAVEAPILPAQPGIFTSNGTLALAFHPDFRPVTPQAPVDAGGGVVVLYATGLGPVENAPATGLPAPGPPLANTLITPQIRVNGSPARVLYSGLAPGFAGLYQLNIQAPAGTVSGPAEVVIESGGVVSRTVTTYVR